MPTQPGTLLNIADDLPMNRNAEIGRPVEVPVPVPERTAKPRNAFVPQWLAVQQGNGMAPQEQRGSLTVNEPQLPTEAPPDLRQKGELWTHTPMLPNGMNEGMPASWVEQTELSPPVTPSAQEPQPRPVDVVASDGSLAAGRRAERTMSGTPDERMAPQAPQKPQVPGLNDPAWVNDTYGEGIKWSDGSINYTNGSGFVPGLGKQPVAPTANNQFNPLKGLFGLFGGG
jgi:hypothetical protein